MQGARLPTPLLTAMHVAAPASYPAALVSSPPLPPRLSLMLPSLSAAASLCCGTRAPPRTTPWTPATRRGNTSPASPMWWPETYVEGEYLTCLTYVVA